MYRHIYIRVLYSLHTWMFCLCQGCIICVYAYRHVYVYAFYIDYISGGWIPVRYALLVCVCVYVNSYMHTYAFYVDCVSGGWIPVRYALLVCMYIYCLHIWMLDPCQVYIMCVCIYVHIYIHIHTYIRIFIWIIYREVGTL